MTITKWLLILLLIAVPTKYGSKYYATQLPKPDLISKSLYEAPYQTSTDEKPSKFKYRGSEYFVRPLADYDIYGLIVSHNNVGSITDSYHTSDAVDFKDLCVVYGETVKNGAYLRGEFSSTSWTCWARFPNQSDYIQEDISNIHILSMDPKIEAVIKNAKIGDQIHLTGNLIEYGDMNNLSFLRKSSLVRNDTGCEVMLVKRASIVRDNSPFFGQIYRVADSIIIILLPLIPIVWVLSIWLNNKKRYKNLK